MNSDEFSAADTGKDTASPLSTGETGGGAGTSSVEAGSVGAMESRLDSLRQQEADLKRSIADLQSSYNRLLKDQLQRVQGDVSKLVQEGLTELEQRKRSLQREVEKLERRQERIRAEMQTTFAGASQDLAVRVQGFKDYLVGSLQDLATAAEGLQMIPPAAPSPTVSEQVSPQREQLGTRRERSASAPPPTESAGSAAAPLGFASQQFEDQTERVRNLLDQYRMQPDYYGPVWQLRRTFEPIHAERVANWFFVQGGRGAIKSMGSRLQNVLVASATISILHTLYGDRLKALVLSNTPERLGEWRRGLQDCLGVSRIDFGTGRGVMLFDAPGPLAQRAERMINQGDLPLIVIDEAEDKISLALLQFPLWLAFAPDPMNPPQEYDYF